jgi:hypothetical protein
VTAALLLLPVAADSLSAVTRIFFNALHMKETHILSSLMAEPT